MAEERADRDLADEGFPRASSVPRWIDNLVALGWRVLVVVGLAVVLWYLAMLMWTAVASVVVAVIVAAVFAPLVLRLRSAGRSRGAAAGIVWVTVIVIGAGLLLVVVIALVPYLQDVVDSIEAGLADLQSRLSEADIPDWIGRAVADAVDTAKESAGDAIGGFVASAAQAVTVLILATFLLFFLLRDGDKAWLWAFQALGDHKREHITTAGDDALARVGGYLRGTTILALTIAITDYLFMFLLGVPLALPLAILAFLAAYIPYFGGIVASGLVLLVTLSAVGPGPALVMLVLLAVRGALLSYLLRPQVYRRTVSIHPALVLIVLPAGFELAGAIGLFAAVPVTALVLAVGGSVVALLEPDPRPVLPGIVPAWLDQVAQFSWRILIAVAFVALLVGILNIVPLAVLTVLLAAVLAATLAPLMTALMRRGRSRGRAAAIAVGGGFLAVAALMTLAFGALVARAPEMAEAASSGARSISDESGGQLDLASGAVSEGAGAAVRAIVGLAEGIAGIVALTVLGTLLAFYLLRDGGQLWRRIIDRIRPDAEAQVDAAGSRAFEVLGGYMLGTAAVSFVGAGSQFVIMIVLGLPLAVPIFVLSFFLGFIPYIGSFISTLMAFLVAVALGDAADVVIMAIWTLVFNLVQGNVVSPVVYGRTVHLHPAVVLVAIPAASGVAGILGMFIIVPALGVVSATWRTVVSVLGLPPNDAALLEPTPPPEATSPDVPTPPPEPPPASKALDASANT